mmetsp:Transcript_30784/g.91541  ORF Transcript_30784/g.91541 Transcript_30784/m.91541 type:complete len:312 (+) Transcript_30784:1042-1977(+)
MARGQEVRAFDVCVNIYDVSRDEGVMTSLNTLGIKSGVGGAFHAGIEVDGLEWSFGHSESGTGMHAVEPREHPSFHFRMSAPLGTVTMSHWQLKHLLKALHGEWEGSRYDKLHLNCCHFCDALCDALGVRRPPRWLNRLANSANTAVVVTHGAIDTVRIGLPHREANRLAGRQAGTDCLAKQTLGFAHSGSQNVQPTPRCNPFACDVHVLHNMDQRRPLSPTHAKAPPPAQPLPPPLPLILASHHPLHIASLAHAAAHPNLAVPRPSLSVCRTSKRRRPPSRPPRLLHIQIWSPPSPIRTFKPCRTLNSLV